MSFVPCDLWCFPRCPALLTLKSDVSDSLPGTRYDSFCFMFRSTFTKSYRVDRVSEETPQPGQFPIRSGECKVTWQKIPGPVLSHAWPFQASPSMNNERWKYWTMWKPLEVNVFSCLFSGFVSGFSCWSSHETWKTRFYLVSLSTHGLAQAATLEDGCFVDAGTIFIKLWQTKIKGFSLFFLSLDERFARTMEEGWAVIFCSWL